MGTEFPSNENATTSTATSLGTHSVACGCSPARSPTYRPTLSRPSTRVVWPVPHTPTHSISTHPRGGHHPSTFTTSTTSASAYCGTHTSANHPCPHHPTHPYIHTYAHPTTHTSPLRGVV